MSKGRLLAAATAEPSMDIHRHQSEFGNVVRPTLEFTQQSQKLVGSISIFLALRVSYFLNSILLVSAFLARHVFHVTKFGIGKTIVLLSLIWRNMRESRGAKRSWRKFEMEITSLLFGPVGNGIALLILWPGWIIAFILWGLWRIIG